MNQVKSFWARIRAIQRRTWLFLLALLVVLVDGIVQLLYLLCVEDPGQVQVLSVGPFESACHTNSLTHRALAHQKTAG